jgi:putative FmdB family regulatory protein
MPIYEYACEKCEREFEVEQRITEDPLKTCPHCRSRKVKRLISQTSFVLKGGGWYSDLYSSTKGSKSSDKDEGSSSSESSETSGSEKSSDEKKGKKDKKTSKGKKGSKAAA